MKKRVHPLKKRVRSKQKSHLLHLLLKPRRSMMILQTQMMMKVKIQAIEKHLQRATSRLLAKERLFTIATLNLKVKMKAAMTHLQWSLRQKTMAKKARPSHDTTAPEGEEATVELGKGSFEDVSIGGDAEISSDDEKAVEKAAPGDENASSNESVPADIEVTLVEGTSAGENAIAGNKAPVAGWCSC